MSSDRVQLFMCKDVARVERLHRSCFPDDEWTSDSTHHWVLTVNNRDAGFCSLRTAGSTVHLTRGGVRKKYRGRGYHKLLIRRRLQWAKRNGYKRARSYTSYESRASLGNLIRAGFRFDVWYQEHVSVIRSL